MTFFAPVADLLVTPRGWLVLTVGDRLMHLRGEALTFRTMDQLNAALSRVHARLDDEGQVWAATMEVP